MSITDGMLFAGGFIISCRELPPSARRLADWKHDRTADLFWAHDPRVPVTVINGTARDLLLIGPTYVIGDDDKLLELLSSCSEKDYFSHLDNLSGRYVIVRSEGGEITVAGDPFGSRVICYSISHSEIVCSHAELLASIINAEKAPDLVEFKGSKFYEGLSVKYFPGDLTLYEGIVNLTPNNELNLRNSQTRRFWPARNAEQQVNFSRFDLRLSAYFKSLRKFCLSHTPYVGLTAGVDTRFITAGLRSVPREPGEADLELRGMLWLGGYSRDDERAVSLTLSKTANIPLYEVECPGPLNEVAKVAGRNSGNIRGASRLSSAIFESIPQSSNQNLFVVGYGGEIIRGFYNLGRSRIKGADVASLSEAYRRRSKAVEPYQDGYCPSSVIERAFEGFIRRSNLSVALSRGYDINDIFYWEHRMANWAALMLDEFVGAGFCIAGLNDRRLFELALAIPEQDRLTKSLFLGYIRRWEPDWNGIPIL